MIRLLLVPSSDFIGHPFPQRHNQIFERLNDRKTFEVHVARFRLFKDGNLKTRLRIHELSGSAGSGPAQYYLANILRHAHEVRKIVRDEKIDLVVLSNLATPFAYLVMDHLWTMGIPTIFDLPDYYPTSATGYMLDTSNGLGRSATAVLDLMLRYIVRRSSAITTVSKGLVHYARSHGARNVFLVRNGISEEFLKLQKSESLRESLGFTRDDFVVGYIGSVDFWLDVEELLDGMNMAKKAGLRAKGMFVGRGLHRQVYSRRLVKLIEQNGLQNDITRLGFIPYEDVPKYMAAIDVGTIPFDVTNPTSYYAAPNKMWEYLSQMKPVVSTPIPEALDNRDFLLLASRGSEYAHHFLAVSSKEKEVCDKVSKGHAEACMRTWERSTDDFAAVCEGVLRGCS